MSIFDKATDEDRMEAARFIEIIENGTIRKRTLPNNAVEYNLEAAMESVIEATKSDEIEDIINSVYD